MWTAARMPSMTSLSISKALRIKVIVEVALQYCDTYNENVFSYVNNINTEEGGTHVAGFRQALTRTINDYARKKNILEGERREPVR
jgi:DNA gyrase/topoisomerase IV subunit B